MVKTKFKKAVSLVLAAVMSLTAFMGIGATTAFAAVGEKADVYLVDYPRSGDTNNNGEWGHGNLNYMNGWKGLSTKYTGLRAMGSYSGNIAYCIEPGTGQRTGDTLTEKDENFFNNISPNGTISGDDIRLLIGRILQYGYRGGISTSWKSQNESDANCIAHAYATQILIWETIVGERDAGFNHVSTGGYNAVLECVSSAHPLRSKILSYYNSMVIRDNLSYYENMYGYDYVAVRYEGTDDAVSYRNITDEIERISFELELIGENEEQFLPDMEFNDDFDEEYDEIDEFEDDEDIDPAIYDDPILMVKWLESRQKIADEEESQDEVAPSKRVS